MVAKIIDGKLYAAKLQADIAVEVAQLKEKHGITPGLAVILVGNDPASEVYVRSKHKRTIEAGMNSFEHKLPAETSEDALLDLIGKLNADSAVHGILVQLPLPPHIDARRALAAIHPSKDVDGFHVTNIGLLASGENAMVPCTPLGCMLLLRDYCGDLSGLEAVVIGRSNIVGKPMLQLLLAANCTVTIAHSRTTDLQAVVKRADIVIAAVGKAELVKGSWIKPGAIVIDVGINRLPDVGTGRSRLVGDVDFTEASAVASAITPVPGGVGPMTIACLLANTLTACNHINKTSKLSAV